MATKDYEVVLHYRLKVVADDTIDKKLIEDHFEGIFSSMTPYNTDLKFKVTDITIDQVFYQDKKGNVNFIFWKD